MTRLELQRPIRLLPATRGSGATALAGVATLLVGVLLLGTTPLAAQDRLPTGVRLGLIYQASTRDRLAVQTFGGSSGLESVAREAEEIVRQDLDFSDRYEMMSVPERYATGAVDYAPLNDLGLVWLVTGSIEPGPILRITLHDVVYGRVREVRSYSLPQPRARDFRMTIHAASDDVVRWTTGQPGIAATRIVFSRVVQGGGYELLMSDYDGENVQRLESHEQHLYSPAWSHDGTRIAYTRSEGGAWELRERDLVSGRTRVLDRRNTLVGTPTYAPDGEHMSFAIWIDDQFRIYRYNAVRECCLQKQVDGPLEDLSPTYSPDGRRMAFQSNRLIQPHIFIARSDGGDSRVFSPYVYGEPGYYTSPEWAPNSSLVAFHGRSRGQHQLMIADADRPTAPVRQITADGWSEDPSWAPDGRHLVFAGSRDGRDGLYVIDSSTGRVRPLVLGRGYILPDWSPTLLNGDRVAAGR